MSWLIELIKDFFSPPPMPEPLPDPAPTPDPSHRLYNAAKELLGKQIDSDSDDDLDCVKALNVVHHNAFGTPIAPTLSTFQLWRALLKDRTFEEINHPEIGAIILSPTGLGDGTISHGHVGICGLYGIMSNDSRTGRWEENYSYGEWTRRFKDVGSFPVYFFRKIAL